MPKQKIAILGGGVGALGTAWELTNVPGWDTRYEITVYQLGWRMGGKGASGRNQSVRNRIQEHGLHLWMGFYENAFRCIREAYDYCHQHNLMPGSPFQSYKDAFSPMNFTSSTEHFEGKYIPWNVVWPPTDQWPGEGTLPAGVNDPGSVIWHYVVRILEFVAERVDQVVTGQASRIPLFPAHFLAGRLAKPLRQAFEKASQLPADPAQIVKADLDAIRQLLDDFLRLFQRIVDFGSFLFRKNQELRRLNTILDTVLAVARGILDDDLIHRGFDSIDGLEFRGWLAKHGCRQPTNTLTISFYDACFAYVDGAAGAQSLNMAAGTMLNGLLRLTLTYSKSIMLCMEAGMGDTIFTPLYLGLKDRGVKFESFQKVTNLGLSPDRRSVDTISIDVQATLAVPEYNPLIPVNGLYCWPAEPPWDQLVEGQAIRNTPVNHDLESYWCAWKPVKQRVLKRGDDFDLVVNGISLGAVPYICKELVAANAKWKLMVDHVKVVRTQAFQLWLHKTASEMGWNPGPSEAPVLTAFVEPYDTWAEMRHLIVRESWQPGDNCKEIAYFCNCMDVDKPPAPFTDPSYPNTQTARARASALQFVNRNLRDIWPGSADPAKKDQFNFDLLVDIQGRVGEAAFDDQFFRANIDPTELYVMSVAGSTDFRLSPGGSGFDNLILAGDWTRVELNIGCVEAAVQSAMMASHAICGSPKFIYGAFGIQIPIQKGSAANA
jgi:uncharacterized protein with NAD-binding domain and iron-sulfur cluster